MATPGALDTGLIQSSTGLVLSQGAIDLAYGLVTAHCGWDMSQVTNVSVVLDSDGGPLRLPSLRVTDVASVTIRGTDSWGTALPQPDPSVWDWSENGLIYWTGTSLLSACNPWPVGPRRATVVYSGGYAFDEFPPALLAVVASVGGRVGAMPSGGMQQHLENVGGIQTNTTYSQAALGGAGFTAVEAAVLSRWRIWALR